MYTNINMYIHTDTRIYVLYTCIQAIFKGLHEVHGGSLPGAALLLKPGHIVFFFFASLFLASAILTTRISPLRFTRSSFDVDSLCCFLFIPSRINQKSTEP